MDRHQAGTVPCKGKTEKVYAYISKLPKDHCKPDFLYFQNPLLS